MFLGSVAEQVLRSVNLPVITVGPEAHLLVENVDLSGREQRVVLHATTLRETSRPSAALACRVAASLKARLVLLNVLPPIDEMRRRGEPTGMDSAAIGGVAYAHAVTLIELAPLGSSLEDAYFDLTQHETDYAAAQLVGATQGA